MVQQVESSLSRWHELDASHCAPLGQHDKDIFIHQASLDDGKRVAALVHERLSHAHDARDTLNTHRYRQDDKWEESNRG